MSASQAASIAPAILAVMARASALARAAAFFTIASARTYRPDSRRARAPEKLKLSSERTVRMPYRRRAGTSSSPMESRSMREAAPSRKMTADLRLAAIAGTLQQFAASRSRLGVVGQQRDQPSDGSANRRHPMNRVAALEQQQRAGRHRNAHDFILVALQQSPHARIVLIARRCESAAHSQNRRRARRRATRSRSRNRSDRNANGAARRRASPRG